MRALISPLTLHLPLCRANEMGVYYAVYNTVTAPVFIISRCCQVQAAHPHTSQCDDITVGYHLISTAISRGEGGTHTQHSALFCVLPSHSQKLLVCLDVLSTDELGITEQKGGERHSQNPKQGLLLWESSEEPGWKTALPCAHNATVKDQWWLR